MWVTWSVLRGGRSPDSGTRTYSRAWTGFLEHFPCSRIPCSALILGRGLVLPHLVSQTCWLPKEGVTPCEDWMGIGNGGGVEQEKGRERELGCVCKMKINLKKKQSLQVGFDIYHHTSLNSQSWQGQKNPHREKCRCEFPGFILFSTFLPQSLNNVSP